MPTLLSILGVNPLAMRIVADTRLVDAELEQLAQRAADPDLRRALHQLFASGGKRLRPALVLLAAHWGAYDRGRAVVAGAAMEMIHAASLIHDDIIDDDAERRGRAALHVQYDPTAAIVTGDLLIFQTFLHYASCRDRGIGAERVLDAIRVLSLTCIEMCEGQALEAAIKGRLDTDEATYVRMIRLKTGSLCRAAAEIGGILADAPDGTVRHLREYGERLGLAFQIMDDILPYNGQPDRLGKPAHSDVRNARVTLPIIYALCSRQAGVRARIDALFGLAESDPLDAHAQIAALLRGCGALDRAVERAVRLHAEAQGHLQHLPPSEAREHLSLLADAALARTH